MARTWSVPQRGNFASSAGLGLRLNAPLKRLANAGIPGTRRGLLLLISAILTAIGIAVLNIDSESLATVLLVAGAGLAATVILFATQTETETAAHLPFSGLSERARLHASAQFPELLSRRGADPEIDRATWAKLTAHMSHELRTPLNAVLGFSELMSKEVFGPLGSSCYGDYARDIHASGRMLLKSAEDALAITALLTCPERKAPQAYGLKSILDGAQAFAQPDLDSRSITIEADVAADADVLCDPQATRQMLINLIAEASRSARNGATIEIAAHTEDDALILSIETENAGADQGDDDSFPLILARTLCELSSARLTIENTPAGVRRWTVRFLAATQNDLFAKRA